MSDNFKSIATFIIYMNSGEQRINNIHIIAYSIMKLV